MIIFQLGVPILYINEAAVGWRIDVLVFASFGMAIDEYYYPASGLRVFPPFAGAAVTSCDPLESLV